MPGNNRPNCRSLITEDLGYCCPWFFFTHFRKTQVITDRLGLHYKTVQAAKREALAGKCEGRANCMHALVTLEGSPRKRPVKP